MGIVFSRFWAIPTADTFDCQPIGDFVKKYLRQSRVSVDPFARNKQWATYTNDLNPNTAAEYHLPANDFLKALAERSVVADLIIFDPPYSRRQVMECYSGIGREFVNQDSQYFSLNWRDERILADLLLDVGGIVLSFGWHSNGMHQSGNYELIEQINVAHGGAHNDTICIAERKAAKQLGLM